MADDDKHDPRSIEEKALADLRANNQMGLAPPESPELEKPSVTPETFGAGQGFKDEAVPSADNDADALSRAKE